MKFRFGYHILKIFSVNTCPCGQVKAKKAKISAYLKWEITRKSEKMPNFKIDTSYDLTKIFLCLSSLKQNDPW